VDAAELRIARSKMVLCNASALFLMKRAFSFVTCWVTETISPDAGDAEGIELGVDAEDGDVFG
jgi:hypothetical protein